MAQSMNTIRPATKGIYFDLSLIFAELNVRYFDNGIDALLSWGKRRTQLRKRTIRLGSYHPNSRTIIIHPCLDQAMVPTICLERILFHEMAHQKFPGIKSKCGKTLVHYEAFYQFERTYPYLKEADLWIKANLHRLLRS